MLNSGFESCRILEEGAYFSVRSVLKVGEKSVTLVLKRTKS